MIKLAKDLLKGDSGVLSERHRLRNLRVGALVESKKKVTTREAYDQYDYIKAASSRP